MSGSAEGSGARYFPMRRANRARLPTITAAPSEDATVVTMPVGALLKVRLRNDPPARWDDPPSSRLLLQIAREVEQNFPGDDWMTGDYGSTVWTLRALAPGVVLLRFRSLPDAGVKTNARAVERSLLIKVQPD